MIAFASPADAQTQEFPEDYTADPLGLIAYYDYTARYASEVQPDSFEVFVCFPDRTNTTVAEIVQVLNNSDLSEYWESVSNDQYSVTFHAGTTVNPPGQVMCADDAGQQASKRYRAALIVGPMGEVAHTVLYTISGTFPTYPNPDDWVFGNNLRHIKIGEWVEGFEQQWIEAIGKYVGATLGLPPSYTGVLEEHDLNRIADNPMDMASSGNFDPGIFNVGTVAVSRYAAGWIDPADVHIHQGGTERITLRASWDSGTQMLAIPSGEQGYFLSLGTRVAKRHDRGIPKEGVESYLVDQRPHQCDTYRPQPCIVNSRRQIPWPHVTTTIRSPIADEFNIPDHIPISELTDPTKHVSQPGDSFTWNDITITSASAGLAIRTKSKSPTARSRWTGSPTTTGTPTKRTSTGSPNWVSPGDAPPRPNPNTVRKGT